MRIPPKLVDEAKAAYPTVQTFDTTVSKFEISFDNASPARFNVASTPLNSQIDVTGGDDLVIPIPKSGNLVVGPITAGADGTIVAVGVGNATATAVLRDSSGASLLEIPITCNPPSPLELIGYVICPSSVRQFLNMITVSRFLVLPSPTRPMACNSLDLDRHECDD